MPYKWVNLETFLDVVRDHIQEEEVGAVDEIVADVLSQNAIDGVSLRPLNGEMDEIIFNSLISSSLIIRVRITSGMELSVAEDMLRRAITALPSLVEVVIGVKVTEAEAESVLSIIRSSPTVCNIGIILGECTEGIAKPIAKYLREASSLKVLTLTWASLYNVNDPAPWSQAAVSRLCDGIGECQSLKRVSVDQPPSDDNDANIAAELLAVAISKSTSLEDLGIALEHRAFLDKFQDTKAVKNFDVCFRLSFDADLDNWIVALERNAPWKPLLSQDIPLALWPSILAKTNGWNKQTSHTPIDALYFLAKEKNDVLLQNVRRRKVRKRKRYQIS